MVQRVTLEVLEGLTLENFRDRLGRRFRMTKDQKTANLSRSEALSQWIEEQRNQLSQTETVGTEN
jgi:hypothetical protein